jgi:hypothetical protein
MPPITAQINLASSLNQSLYTEHPDPTTLQAGTEMDALTRGTMPRQETSCRDKKRRGNTETAGGVSIPPIPRVSRTSVLGGRALGWPKCLRGIIQELGGGTIYYDIHTQGTFKFLLVRYLPDSVNIGSILLLILLVIVDFLPPARVGAPPKQRKQIANMAIFRITGMIDLAIRILFFGRLFSRSPLTETPLTYHNQCHPRQFLAFYGVCPLLFIEVCLLSSSSLARSLGLSWVLCTLFRSKPCFRHRLRRTVDGSAPNWPGRRGLVGYPPRNGCGTISMLFLARLPPYCGLGIGKALGSLSSSSTEVVTLCRLLRVTWSGAGRHTSPAARGKMPMWPLLYFSIPWYPMEGNLLNFTKRLLPCLISGRLECGREIFSSEVTQLEPT